MSSIWMVRAGEGGRLIEEFEKGYVAVGWGYLNDMSKYSDKDEMRQYYEKVATSEKKGALAAGFAMFYKFHSVFAVGDRVVTYDPPSREYLIGTITGGYQYKEGLVGDYPHYHTVDWQGRVSRDEISTSSKNSLGSIMTLFSVSEDVWNDLQAVLSGEKKSMPEQQVDEEESTIEGIREEIKEKAHEFIKDKILALDPAEMEELAAALLRGMGYRTRISPQGPDRGVDILALPDGLGLEQPRIKTEVKHRPRTAMGSSEIRSFLGGLREGDKAIYVSTGGYSKDAKYEADRSNIPITLLDLDELAKLVVTYYDNFDLVGRTLIPLVQVYWPAD